MELLRLCQETERCKWIFLITGVGVGVLMKRQGAWDQNCIYTNLDALIYFSSLKFRHLLKEEKYDAVHIMEIIAADGIPELVQGFYPPVRVTHVHIHGCILKSIIM